MLQEYSQRTNLHNCKDHLLRCRANRTEALESKVIANRSATAKEISCSRTCISCKDRLLRCRANRTYSNVSNLVTLSRKRQSLALCCYRSLKPLTNLSKKKHPHLETACKTLCDNLKVASASAQQVRVLQEAIFALYSLVDTTVRDVQEFLEEEGHALRAMNDLTETRTSAHEMRKHYT
jgi:hypothetical protein